jgi:hypothetical protein
MPDRSRKHPKRPRDPNELAFRIAQEATGEAPACEPEPPEDPVRKAAAELGRRGGLKGGKARAAKMTPDERRESARKAARARWGRE